MSIAIRPVVLADALPIPKVKARTIALVVGFALLTAAAAQVKIGLGWTPVPITGQTFAMLLSGAVLGSRLGPLSQILYVVMGFFLPFYAGDAAGNNSGWEYASGATGGYLVGMIVASYFVGVLAERSQDRTLITALPAMLFGSAIVYVFGATWLAHDMGWSAKVAIERGIEPYVVGDALKSLAAGAFLPLAWKLSGKDK